MNLHDLVDRRPLRRSLSIDWLIKEGKEGVTTAMEGCKVRGQGKEVIFCFLRAREAEQVVVPSCSG